MIYALDTMVVSEPRKPRPHGAVLAWYRSHPLASLAIPAFVFFELQEGADLTRRQDADKARELDEWIELVAARFTVLAYTAEVARETARLLHNQSRALLEDAAIAATAKVYGLTVATRNTRHFKLFHVPIVDPFQFGKIPQSP